MTSTFFCCFDQQFFPYQSPFRKDTEELNQLREEVILMREQLSTKRRETTQGGPGNDDKVSTERNNYEGSVPTMHSPLSSGVSG